MSEKYTDKRRGVDSKSNNKEPLGILYFLTSFPKLSESFILNEIAELENRGHEVAVFAMRESGEEVTHEEFDSIDIPIYYADVSYSNLPELVSRNVATMALENPTLVSPFLFTPRQIGQAFLLGKRCAEVIERLGSKIDIIYAHFARPSRVGAIHASEVTGTPCAVTAHAYDIFKEPKPSQIRCICDGMDHVIVPSQYNREYLQDKIGVTNDITVVPATTNVEKFEPVKDAVENRILTVGRLVEKKGHEYALAAVSGLVKSGYDIQYHIIGSGRLEFELRELVRDLGITNHVNFLGNVSDERLRRELSEASVFVLPCVIADSGDRDAMPVVLKEAMAGNRPCISTTVSAIPELITDGEDGILVPPRDSKALETEIRSLLDNPEERERLATNGWNTVHNLFDIERSVDSLEDVFESLTMRG